MEWKKIDTLLIKKNKKLTIKRRIFSGVHIKNIQVRLKQDAKIILVTR